MMTFSYVDVGLLTEEEKKYLASINKWICYEDYLQQVYVVKDNNDIKTVFSISLYQDYTHAYATVTTKEKECNKGYFDFGFHMIMEVIKSNPSINIVDFDICHDASKRICKKYGIPEISSILYQYKNPNFNQKYDILFDMVLHGTPLDTLMEFCYEDEVMVDTLNYWLGLHSNGRKLKYS